MNGIYGLFNFNGAPVATEQLATMQQAFAFWALDGETRWCKGEIGMGCQHLATTPEAVGDYASGTNHVLRPPSA